MGKRTLDGTPSAASFLDVRDEFENLESRAPRPMRCVFRKPTQAEIDAARTVQRYTRGNAARKTLAGKIDTEEQHAAATKVQATVRRRRASVAVDRQKALVAREAGLAVLAEHAENCDGNMAEKYKLTLEARCQKLEETLTLWDTGYSSLAELMMGVNKTTPIWGQSTAGDPNGISAARNKMYIALLKDPKFWEADMALRVVQSWCHHVR